MDPVEQVDETGAHWPNLGHIPWSDVTDVDVEQKTASKGITFLIWASFFVATTQDFAGPACIAAGLAMVLVSGFTRRGSPQFTLVAKLENDRIRNLTDDAEFADRFRDAAKAAGHPGTLTWVLHDYRKMLSEVEGKRRFFTLYCIASMLLVPTLILVVPYFLIPPEIALGFSLLVLGSTHTVFWTAVLLMGVLVLKLTLPLGLRIAGIEAAEE